MTPIHETPIWRKLERHRDTWRTRHLRDLLAHDAGRFDRLSIALNGLLFDFSRHFIDAETLLLFEELAATAGIAMERERLFTGARVNVTEDRAALHTALRLPDGVPLVVGGEDLARRVREERARMAAFAAAVREGVWRGATGERISDVVNIGIGGSHLGPEMVVRALASVLPCAPRVHFLANVDPHVADAVLAGLDPARTLVIVASKTFTTAETMANARTARSWLVARLGEAAVARHFVAVSSNLDAVKSFGIEPANVFAMWDWVGGRYSLWSAIGLPIVLAFGMPAFERLLEGAHAMDRHFATAEPAHNAPLLAALLGVWYTDFFGAATHAVIPYRDALKLLPAHLQQLEMESNGKHIDREGRPIAVATCPVLWGDVGTNGQHAFFQLLHQGTQLVPVDFILTLDGTERGGERQRMLVANGLAQAEALARGRTASETRAMLAAQGLSRTEIERLVPHMTFPGNRPSTVIVLDRLEPRTLGALVAFYEHKVFVQSCLWGNNAFDQPGVELGKQLAGALERALASAAPAEVYDPPLRALLAYVARRLS
ncbi:MAG TPA: glucose-6-phosphate isomerase [Gammaproteobacteria bacterium]|nr:glucose-6-phosphate isomerase [Gammaproteobacteria bacterium]